MTADQNIIEITLENYISKTPRKIGKDKPNGVF